MALGGLIENLALPVSVDDGWGLPVDMTHRGYNITAGVVYGGGVVSATGEMIAVRVDAYLGKVINGDFKVYQQLNTATFTAAELKAMGNNVTLTSLITAAKTKMSLT